MAVLKYSVALSTGARSTKPLGGHHGCSFSRLSRRPVLAPSHHRLSHPRPATGRVLGRHAQGAVLASLRRLAATGGISHRRAGAFAGAGRSHRDRTGLMRVRVPRRLLPPGHTPSGGYATPFADWGRSRHGRPPSGNRTPQRAHSPWPCSIRIDRTQVRTIAIVAGSSCAPGVTSIDRGPFAYWS